jgi:hypothetical protein
MFARDGKGSVGLTTVVPVHRPVAVAHGWFEPGKHVEHSAPGRRIVQRSVVCLTKVNEPSVTVVVEAVEALGHIGPELPDPVNSRRVEVIVPNGRLIHHLLRFHQLIVLRTSPRRASE